MFKFIEIPDIDILVYYDKDIPDTNIWYEYCGDIHYTSNESEYGNESYNVRFIVDHVKEFIQEEEFNSYDGSIFWLFSSIVSIGIMKNTGIFVPPDEIVKEDAYREWIRSVVSDMLQFVDSK